MLLYYIRHGDPIYEPDSLTALGERQAEALGRRLCRYPLNKIFVSSSNRARLTAQPICEMLKIEPTVLDWCNENYAWRDLAPVDETGYKTWFFNVPGWVEIFHREEIRQLGRLWYTHPLFANTRAAEGMQRIQRETDALMASLGYRHDLNRNGYLPEKPNDERVALFAHQGFGLAFLSCLTDIPYPVMCSHFDLCHSGMTVIHFSDTGSCVYPKILCSSSDSHIYREGLPTKYNNEIYI